MAGTPGMQRGAELSCVILAIISILGSGPRKTVRLLANRVTLLRFG